MATIVNSIKKLDFKNLTVFPEAHFEFSNGLNLIAGENGSGKTHILKACYSIVDSCTSLDPQITETQPKKGELASSVAKKLVGVLDQISWGVWFEGNLAAIAVKSNATSLPFVKFTFHLIQLANQKLRSIDVHRVGWKSVRFIYRLASF